ncbi:LLM class flavin-dependent oxidoreductase [Pseudonocardia spinosispora]|uniref:LLM class flavin-dependent oxidoreductase n=1 Tax=Pseudonocardia spinosispora TaxID=103441 RepID=UPI000416D7A5|nr:LLM class flavin-dependent oxidoreductase [Pseudonocardia spinosispora]
MESRTSVNLPVARENLRAGVFMPPWSLPLGLSPTTAIHRELDFVDFLDRVGYDEAWIGEHHSGGMEIIASPELFIAAAIERTERIRLGTGVISLPYHNPLMTADRIVQLDHQARGRAMFGFGPGLLPADAAMLGIPADSQRARMADAVEVIVRLLAGETVTRSTDWYTLEEATLHLGPFTRPRPHLAVASAITPSAGRVAGRHGMGLLCVAAGSGPGYDVLDLNWRIAQEVAAEYGQVMDRSGLRVVAPFHIAESRDQALAEVKHGHERWSSYVRDTLDGGPELLGMDSLERINEEGHGAIGTVEDAVNALSRYWDKAGGFGCILNQHTHWADEEATRRSYRTFVDEVMPAFTGSAGAREQSHDWTRNRRGDLSARALGAASKAIEEHFRTAIGS